MADRPLVRETDRVFQDYLGRYTSPQVFEQIDWWDLVFWEYRMSAWNGLVISAEHRTSFNIDIPYNNRVLLRDLLRTPLAARIDDQPDRDIREHVNPDINALGVKVVNVKHTRNRARMERAYLEIGSRLPF